MWTLPPVFWGALTVGMLSSSHSSPNPVPALLSMSSLWGSLSTAFFASFSTELYWFSIYKNTQNCSLKAWLTDLYKLFGIYCTARHFILGILLLHHFKIDSCEGGDCNHNLPNTIPKSSRLTMSSFPPHPSCQSTVKPIHIAVVSKE